MPKLRFVHLSDIHFGQEHDGTLILQEDIRDAVRRDCEIMAHDLGSANGILVTGDIAFSGIQPEYERAGVWLDTLANVVGCPKIAVHTIPGNHDVDRRLIDLSTRLIHQHIRTQGADALDGILADLASEQGQVSPLLTKLAAYRQFASRYSSDFESAVRPVSTKDVYFESGHVLRFRGLSSVQVSDQDDWADRMVLGCQQYVFGPDTNVEYVVMSHHPLHWFKDRAAARNHLHSRARVLLLGHEHQGAMRKIEENGADRIEIDAGAATPPGQEKLPYTYNWLEFDLTQNGMAPSLQVTVHPRVWIPARTAFDADRNRLAGQNAMTAALRCPNYRPIAPAQRPGAAATLTMPVVVREGEATAVPDDEKFAKLLFYFWRYLDWRQRLEALVKADALPAGLDKPIPQVLERNALVRARDQQKLSVIWDAVMERVPEAEREANPYRAGGEGNA